MITYYLHDGRNEAGPFTIDQLNQQKLSRSTPVRQDGKDNWFPAEKLPELKETLVPRKIRTPKDIVPGVIERVSDLKQKRPTVLYAILFCLALFASVSIYKVEMAHASNLSASMPATSPPQPMINNSHNQAEKISLKKQDDITDVQVQKKHITVEERQPEVKKDRAKIERQKWTKLIVATNSNYGIGLLGGIKDLKVIITNHSSFPVEEAVAKVTYIKAGGGVWKTKLVPIYDIASNDTKEEKVADVGRGKKVKISLYKVVSKKMKLHYTEGKEVSDFGEPDSEN